MQPNWDNVLYIKGKSTLWVVMGRSPHGIIVAPIDNLTRKMRLSHALDATFLKDIFLFGKDEDDVPLRKVYGHFYKHWKNDLPVDAHTNDDTLRAFFADQVSMLDASRIYTSHMRKIIKWYLLLTTHGFTFDSPSDEGASPNEHDAQSSDP